MKRQAVYHPYGTDDDDDNEEVTDEESNRTVATKQARVRRTYSANAKCKCGSSEHRYTSHHLCPLNKKTQASNRVVSDTTVQQDSCNSDTEAHLLGQTEQLIAACVLSTQGTTVVTVLQTNGTCYLHAC